jgi:hypothetical protein
MARKLLELTSSTDNHETIGKDSSIINMIADLMISSDADVQALAARSVRFLSGTPASLATLRAHATITSRLEAIMESASPVARDNARVALANIHGDKENAGAASAAPSMVRATPKKVEKPRAVTVNVDGLSQAGVRRTVQRSLFGVPGVISVTVNERKGHVVVWAKARDGLHEELVNVLNRGGVDGASVSEEGVGAGGGRGTEPLRAHAPRYLDEDDDAMGSGAISKGQRAYQSLAARKAAKLREERVKAGQQHQVQSFLSGITSTVGSVFSLW